MDYSKVKKLDEESLQKMTEGTGPSDKCICNLLYTPEKKTGFRSGVRSIKKALASFGGRKSGKKFEDSVSIKKALASFGGRKSGKKFEDNVEVPLTFTKGANGILSTKEIVKRNSSCGKCGCDNEKIVLKHSLANIRIVTPDISNICPCPEDCLPDKANLQNNIKVTIEHVKLFNSDDESDVEFESKRSMSEPRMAIKTSLMSMVDEKYDDFEYESSREDTEDEKSDDKAVMLKDDDKAPQN